jgi:hypothetical protein
VTAPLDHVRRLFPQPGPPGLFDRAVITVSFHPDRLLADGVSVAEHLAADGEYHSQFRTGISNGGLTAYPGGDRDRWEQRMFPGCYRSPDGRPVYGALNLAGYPDGASPRFGSCHLVLSPAVSARATFSHGDSVTLPSVVGTADTFGAVWAALLDQVTTTGRALNLAAPSAASWVAALGAARRGPGRALDDYVEAQVHGGLRLPADVTAVVADASFRRTGFEPFLARLGSQLRWSPAFRLPAEQFPADLRGPAVPPLARFIASRYRTAELDAATIGRAARSVVRDPAFWSSFGTQPEVLQLIKYLWHILVLRGEWST